MRQKKLWGHQLWGKQAGKIGQEQTLNNIKKEFSVKKEKDSKDVNNYRLKSYNSIINTSYLKFYTVPHLLHLPSPLFDFLTIWKRLIVIVVLVFFLFLVLVGLGPGRGTPWWAIANLGLHVGKLVGLQPNDGGPVILFRKKKVRD